jgi:spore coat polysaccharide biosynthesis predicted glycosyltransferase SpsG
MILVRLDITKKIGTGHFRRMDNLANYMSSTRFIFLIYTDNRDSQILCNRQIFYTSKKDEYDDIRTILEQYSINTIILDMLHYEKGYIEKIKKITKRKIVSFHEYNDISKHSDLKINYNLFNGFENVKDPTFLTGYKYIIFNDEIEKYRNNSAQDYVFVSFGGSDPSKLTSKFIIKVASKLPETNFLIHIGNFNADKISPCANVQIVYRPENLFKHIAGAKLAVISGGNMMYESIYLGVPSVVIAHNKHQETFSMNANKYGCVSYLGLGNNIDYNSLKDDIKNKIFNCDSECTIIIDNKGKERIKEAILGLSVL